MSRSCLDAFHVLAPYIYRSGMSRVKKACNLKVLAQAVATEHFSSSHLVMLPTFCSLMIASFSTLPSSVQLTAQIRG